MNSLPLFLPILSSHLPSTRMATQGQGNSIAQPRSQTQSLLKPIPIKRRGFWAPPYYSQLQGQQQRGRQWLPARLPKLNCHNNNLLPRREAASFNIQSDSQVAWVLATTLLKPTTRIAAEGAPMATMQRRLIT